MQRRCSPQLEQEGLPWKRLFGLPREPHYKASGSGRRPLLPCLLVASRVTDPNRGTRLEWKQRRFFGS